MFLCVTRSLTRVRTRKIHENDCLELNEIDHDKFQVSILRLIVDTMYIDPIVADFLKSPRHTIRAVFNISVSYT